MINSKKAVGVEHKPIERNVVINGTHIRVKSVFSGTIPLEKALGNIAKRKLTAKAKN